MTTMSDEDVCKCGHDVEDHEHLSAHVGEKSRPLIPCTVEGCGCSCFDVKDEPCDGCQTEWHWGVPCPIHNADWLAERERDDGDSENEGATE